MKIHHLLPGRAEHHIPAMIRFFARIHERLGAADAEPVFVFYDATPAQIARYRALLPGGCESIALRRGRVPVFRYVWGFSGRDALVLHSAFYPWLWLSLLARPGLWERSAWIMWGADIYGRRTLRGRVYRVIKGFVVKRLGGVSALVPGDFDDLQRLIGPCPNYIRAFYSPDYGELPAGARDGGGTTRVILGNSAWEQSNHVQALQWLGRFRDKPVEVICPLGYPKESPYKSEVISAGGRLLGERFRPLPEMVGWDDYNALLATCHVLVLNSLNQQGLGNLYCMLRAGAKIYIRGDCAIFRMLTEMGFSVYDTRDLERISFEEFADYTAENAQRNRQLFEENLSAEASIDNWLALLRKLGVAKAAA
ncbi:MAG: TDP-N-acetylfucosamine:lipid II N-acetylfucosaminyltransferase [Candidatus Sumerlaeia bacterium]